MIFLEFILFFFIIFFTFFIPGLVILNFLKFSENRVISLALSFGIGISLFLIFVYLLSWIKLEYLYLVFPTITTLIFLKNIKRFKFYFAEIPKAEVIIIFFGSLLTSYFMWRSGSIENNSLVFYGVNSVDAIYHLSLIENLKNNFPPTHPGLGGIELKGYNFFYDLIISFFSKIYRFNSMDLFFRLFPLFISVFYGISGWALGKFLKMKREIIIIFLTLLYFAQSFSRFVFPDKVSYDPGVVQTIANIVDPSVLLSVSLLFIFFILIFSKKTKKTLILAALVLSVLPMIKIYTGFLAFMSLGLIFLIRLITKKDFSYLFVLLLGGILFLVTYLPINFGAGRLIFAPNLIYRHYLESISNVYNLTWYQRLMVFEAHDNYPKIIFYKFLLVLPLFYLPSLGLRLINLLYLKKIFDRSIYSEKNLFLGFFIALGFILPSFFIQSTAVFVVIQFLWIAYFILLIPTAFSLGKMFGKINNKKLWLIVCLIVFFSIPDNFRLIELYSKNPYKIDLGLYEAAQKISNIPQNEGVMVLNVLKRGETYDAMYLAPVVSGLSGHNLYFEPELMEFGGLDSEIRNRKKEIGDLNEEIIKCENPSVISTKLMDFSSRNNTNYILDLNKTPCFDKLENIELIFNKSSYSIYKII